MSKPRHGCVLRAINREFAHNYAYGCSMRWTTTVHSVGCDAIAEMLDAKDAALAAEQRAHAETRADLAEQLPMRDADAMTIGNLTRALADTRRKLDEAREALVGLSAQFGADYCDWCQRNIYKLSDHAMSCPGRIAREALARLDTPASTPVAGEACRCMKGDGHEPHPGRTCGRMVDLEDFEAPCRCKGAPTPDTKGAP